MTPIIFSEWKNWVDINEEERNSLDMNNKQDNQPIRAMGETIGPSWVRYEFDDFEEFYKYYCDLLGVGY